MEGNLLTLSTHEDLNSIIFHLSSLVRVKTEKLRKYRFGIGEKVVFIGLYRRQVSLIREHYFSPNGKFD